MAQGNMRVAIASRIFDPEPSAASFRLGALASAFSAAGHDTEVLTVTPTKGALAGAPVTPYRVRRWPVFRDRSGYVRGYVQYMSFDIPLFFRLLFGRKRDLIVSEPPPTTGFFVRIAAALRRTPYAYYAADIWSDAAAQTDAPAWMVSIVRRIELAALRGASSVLSVSEGVTMRLAQLGITERVVTIGNGVDTRGFATALARDVAIEGDAGEGNGSAESTLEFVYAGTASEWHGAAVFLEAMPAVLAELPGARLRFIGGGSERPALEERAAELGVAPSVTFEPVKSATDLAPVLRDAAAAVASVRSGVGYDFAFPTKLYSAAACGAAMIYSGPGPAIDFVRTEVDGVPLGIAVDSDPAETAAAMIACGTYPLTEVRRATVQRWAAEHVSLDAVAARVISALSD